MLSGRMYEIRCEQCERIGFHPSRIGAESKAERHQQETGHQVSVVSMQTT